MNPDIIFWVLTVPATWNEPAKELLRVAAIEVNKGFDEMPSASGLRLFRKTSNPAKRMFVVFVVI